MTRFTRFHFIIINFKRISWAPTASLTFLGKFFFLDVLTFFCQDKNENYVGLYFECLSLPISSAKWWKWSFLVMWGIYHRNCQFQEHFIIPTLLNIHFLYWNFAKEKEITASSQKFAFCKNKVTTFLLKKF